MVINARLVIQELCVQLQNRFDLSDIVLKSYSSLNPESNMIIQILTTIKSDFLIINIFKTLDLNVFKNLFIRNMKTYND